MSSILPEESRAQPNSHLNGRSIPLSMGKVLGGGSSINVMAWARGHLSDWDFLAKEAADPAWSYASVLQIYRRIEDWHGAPDPRYRGTGGPVFVEPAPAPNSIAPALLEAAHSVGIATYENQNGCMMEGDGGASISDVRARAGKRQSVFRSYFLSHPDDLSAAIACLELCREIGNSAALRPFNKREVMPGNLKGAALEHFICDAAITYWHETCTARMGRDPCRWWMAS